MKERFGMLMESEMKRWATEQADRLGISLSAYINVLVSQEKARADSIQSMAKVENIMKRMEELNK